MSLKEQTQTKIAQTRKEKPEFMQKVDDLVAQAKSFQEGENAIQLDQKAPVLRRECCLALR